MKIALVRYRFTPFGGAERYMARLITGLRQAGHEVHVFAARWEDDDADEVSIHRVPVIGWFGWLKALTFSLNCRRLLRQGEYDVVFSLERTLKQDIYRAGDGCHRVWLQQKGRDQNPLARFLTRLNPVQAAYLLLERRLFRDPQLKAIIANSRRGKDEIVSCYGVHPGKIHVVYNGVDLLPESTGSRDAARRSLAAEYGLGDELRLLYVGSGFRRKGVPTILRAAALLQVPFKLFIVGKGPLGRYQRMAIRLGIAGRVVFTGPQRDVDRFYLGSDLFVFPTLYDPFSNATLEAMASGLPVITTPFNGVSELLVDGAGGAVIGDPLDHQALAEAIERLAPAAERYRQGKIAAEIARALTMEQNVRETMAVIAGVRCDGMASGRGLR